ncbi:efflux RND transporter periplasmic adaptor subunit [Thalassomonas haliotis]|uniref:HlyD family efflux transporter periplasmic adaptor subunit n=1 Tax=Thalassomonas haliotis TaxID=485448 RepID=A0ABY7VAZ4_9GAMM|nr:HlyD family efflux transporter periplasmic adaptor subunit [Thalassomonas haliotis]WDE10405.1 HlyD family efflux transporter periplasmic adaptor subunit [Thalassomonas haliotis]
MNKYYVSLLGCLLLVGCGEEVITERVKQETVEVFVAASGELESRQVSVIAPPSVGSMWQYQIKQLAPENTKVSKGQVVISFDDKKVSERLIEKQAELDRAQQELENKQLKEIETEQELTLKVAQMQMEYEKAKRKAEIIDNSRSDIDRKKAQIDFTIAENDLALAKKQLLYQQETKDLNIKLAQGKVARLTSEVDAFLGDIEKLKVKAPRDGMVIYKANWEGEKPAVGETVRFGQGVMEIAVLEQMQLTVQVSEAESGKIAVGQLVKVYLGAAQELIYRGRVQSLGKVFRDKSQQDKRRIFDVIVEFEQTDIEVMRPGMTARVEVITETLDDVLTISQQAVKNSGGENFVVKSSLTANKDELISISHVLGTKVVVDKGLTAGDEVVL